MAVLREYELTDGIESILTKMQEEIFGDAYYVDGIYETWNDIEEIADKYGIRKPGSTERFGSFYAWDPSAEQREEMLFDPAFAPYIECVRERELPPAQPGHMYFGGAGSAKSFSEIDWHARLAQQSDDCRCCRGSDYREHPFFPLVLEEDDGTTSVHWHWCNSIWNGMGDDIGEIATWNEDGRPGARKGECPDFEWS